MENPYELKMQLICNDLEYTLKNKRSELTPTTKAHINDFIQEITNLIMSIDSINIDRPNSMPGITTAFYFSPNLKEVIEISGHKNEIEKGNLTSTKTYLACKKALAEQLLNDPHNFFKQEQSILELITFVKSYSDLYTKEYRVLSHVPAIA